VERAACGAKKRCKWGIKITHPPRLPSKIGVNRVKRRRVSGGVQRKRGGKRLRRNEMGRSSSLVLLGMKLRPYADERRTAMIGCATELVGGGCGGSFLRNDLVDL